MNVTRTTQKLRLNACVRKGKQFLCGITVKRKDKKLERLKW